MLFCQGPVVEWLYRKSRVIYDYCDSTTNKLSINNFDPPVIFSDVSSPPRDTPVCRTETSQSAHQPPGVAATSDATLSSSSSSSPMAQPGTGVLVSASGLHSRSNSVERLLEAASGSSDDYHDTDGSRRTRAVENQYSFYWHQLSIKLSINLLLLLADKRQFVFLVL